MLTAVRVHTPSRKSHSAVGFCWESQAEVCHPEGMIVVCQALGIGLDPGGCKGEMFSVPYSKAQKERRKKGFKKFLTGGLFLPDRPYILPQFQCQLIPGTITGISEPLCSYIWLKWSEEDEFLIWSQNPQSSGVLSLTRWSASFVVKMVVTCPPHSCIAGLSNPAKRHSFLSVEPWQWSWGWNLSFSQWERESHSDVLCLGMTCSSVSLCRQEASQHSVCLPAHL